MKKPNKQQLEAQFAEVKKENSLLLRGLNSIINGQVEFSVAFGENEFRNAREKQALEYPGVYTYRFMRMDAPDGGIVAITFSTSGQSDYTSLYSVEDLAYLYRDFSSIDARMFKMALERYHSATYRQKESA